ncbi:molybdopterin-dependent oxidoreductase [Candidatus Parcubacteria bacterium]|nr:molybdopterin-dependent oxidoreductase [Candidatus Parcubacteria bacterium]
MLTPDSKNFNHSYIKAKEAQVKRHEQAHAQTDDPNRLPPGQVKTDRFPILDLGVRPTRDLYPMWKVTVEGLIEHSVEWSLDALRKLGEINQTADFHCVTRWSAYDLHWTGIPFAKVMEAVKPKPEAEHVIFHSFDGYTTNVPLEELMKPNVLVALQLDGKEIPPYTAEPSGGPPGLSPEHGGPVRMIIPHLYGWKSAKFLTMIRFVEEDEPGFWEVRGYNNHGDPWGEERYR